MSKTPRARKMPFTAIPVSLFGEAACARADELGVNVDTYSLRGSRELSTADARAFMAGGEGRGQAIWLVLAHALDTAAFHAATAAL